MEGQNPTADGRVMPASPALASSFLSGEPGHHAATSSSGTWVTGIKSLDDSLPDDLWMGGKVIGVASIENVHSPVEHIVATHLLTLRGDNWPSSARTAAFIIAPHTTNIVPAVYSVLIKRVADDADSEGQRLAPVDLLETVQLLRYFDFAGLAESVSEVSTRLFEMGKAHSNAKTPEVPRMILYVEGLWNTIDNAQRRSGVVQANALLTSLLRTLTHLSRSYPCLLVMLEVGVRRDGRLQDELQSAFASGAGETVMLQLGGALGWTLEAGLDVIVLVREANGRVEDESNIVEVVRDRVGCNLGAWTEWTS